MKSIYILSTLFALYGAGTCDNKVCYIYQQKVTQSDGSVKAVPYRNDLSLQTCSSQCPPPPDPNKTSSVTCALLGDPKWTDAPDMNTLFSTSGIQSAPATCTCDNAGVDAIADDFVKGLAAIGDVACEVWVAVLAGFVDYIIDTVIDTIDSAESAVNAMGGLTDNHKDITQGALQFHNATTDLSSAKDCFGKWLVSKVCPAGALSQDQTNSIFDAVYNVNQIVVGVATLPAGGEGLAGFVLTKPAAVAGDAGKVFGDIPKMAPPLKDPPNAIKPKPKPTDKPKETATPKTTADPKTTPKESAKESAKSTITSHSSDKSTQSSASSTASACSYVPDKNPDDPSDAYVEPGLADDAIAGLIGSIGKRAPAAKRQKCGDPTITSIVGSSAVLSTTTYTCTSSYYGQGCANAWSAIKNYNAASRFTCGDNWVTRRKEVDNHATNDWSNQHADKTWTAFTASAYDFAPSINGKKIDGVTASMNIAPSCQRDEWPPAYWLPAKGDAAAQQPQWGQRVRLIPAAENGGVGNAWNSFCKRNDGGEGNNQRIGKNQKNDGDNTAELAAALVTSNKAQASRTTSTVNKGKTTTIEYYTQVPFQRAVFEIAFDNKPGLEANQFMLEENPCWPKDLVPEDPGFVLLTDDKYYQTQNKDFAAKSFDWKPATAPSNGRKGIYNYAPDAARLAAAQKKRPDVKVPAPKLKRDLADDSLELVYEAGHLMIRDHYLNETRPLTDDEENRIEVSHCSDRWCAEEEGDLLIPGHIPSKPAVNDAEPTIHVIRSRRAETMPTIAVEAPAVTPAP